MGGDHTLLLELPNRGLRSGVLRARLQPDPAPFARGLVRILLRMVNIQATGLRRGRTP